MTELQPATEDDLAAILRDAAGRGDRLTIRGGGTRALAEGQGGAVLSTAGLTGISLYEPGALTLVARAGTPLAEIEAALAAEGQMLPFEPWDARALTGRNGTPTIGGVVATNASGPRRIQAGACRDSMIGVRFVDGAGTVVKNGGRVMKNVTGLDLVKLMAGSHGTLGVISEVAFKLLPRPEATASVVLDGLSADEAVRAMTAALGTPFQVSGAAHLFARPDVAATTLLRLEGFAGSVAYRAGGLARALRRFGAGRIVEGPGDWPALRDAALFGGREGSVWRVSVKPTEGARVAAALAPAETMLDWGGGLIWALAPEHVDLRAALAGMPGHATLVRASTAAVARHDAFHPEPAPVAAIAAGLRARFDPAGVLNQGLMASRVSVPA